MSRKTNVMVSSTLRTIGVMTVATSLLWTSISIYNSLKQPVDLKISPEILAPISPEIDMETIDKLKEKRQLSESAGSDEVIRQALEILLIEPEESETASEGATPEPTL